LLERRALVVANKLDLLSEERIPEILSAIGDAAITAGIDFDHNVIGISAGVTGVGLSELSKAIRAIVTQSEEDRERELLEFQGSA
jgi:50S ribosomal subunit-associated GTPase HflX